MTGTIETFLRGRSPAPGLYVERGGTQPTMEALRWATELRAMLDLAPRVKEEGLALVAACLRSSGAYAGSPDRPEPALDATYYATKVLALAGDPRRLTPQLATWLSGVVFGPSGNVRLDVDELFYAVRAMEFAGQSLDAGQAHRVATFVRACADPGGGFGLLPGAAPDIERTYCCVLMLGLLTGWSAPAEHRAFVAACLRDGLFLFRPGDPAGPSLAAQYWGLRAARLAGVPVAGEALRAYVAGLRNDDGGYGVRGGGPGRGSTLWESYCALRVSALLDEGEAAA
ncbi:terpene cyclase/mutase family protein [Actinomadura sp. ATCC 31491]|uniref:Geranylgeranyl transferase type II subunit beta n=1 Tax=Actinomadura luzonensis TaxID=2805427 RepID=A0ABT0FU60_9ACTN|nr:prenyltransferase/squalene oxidase repeat-containing protein [Actinomadura luzonensis]MCK2215431.1 terpene cyclase/mutase family protein [Actinomadura luzonensis]